MPRDRSLDEFASGEAEAAAEAEPATEPTTDEGDAGGSDSGGSDTGAAEAGADTTASSSGTDTDPAVTTFQWSPDGRECAECGATVDRRWRDGSLLVCAECKTW
ncbi:DUF7573 domain-containing protein [Haloarchaeobius amylolyticus]|uniref:DUF7573 domain-containing protein n=1 Tax=Haloarchaeobius amylolyticus TaxID=1198296 RepID=UPI00226DDC52|nr:hypothetical protein [Haloarchaeobius amylolyticus]